HRPDSLSWKTSQPIGGDIVEEIRRLKAAKGPDLHLWGSGNVLQTLIAADLIDEHRLWVFPVILGRGKRLFENGVPARGFNLVSPQTTPTGVIANTSHPTGPIPKE